MWRVSDLSAVFGTFSQNERFCCVVFFTTVPFPVIWTGFRTAKLKANKRFCSCHWGCTCTRIYDFSTVQDELQREVFQQMLSWRGDGLLSCDAKWFCVGLYVSVKSFVRQSTKLYLKQRNHVGTRFKDRNFACGLNVPETLCLFYWGDIVSHWRLKLEVQSSACPIRQSSFQFAHSFKKNHMSAQCLYFWYHFVVRNSALCMSRDFLLLLIPEVYAQNNTAANGNFEVPVVCVCARKGPVHTGRKAQNAGRWNFLLWMGVFTLDASNINGFARNFACPRSVWIGPVQNVRKRKKSSLCVCWRGRSRFYRYGWMLLKMLWFRFQKSVRWGEAHFQVCVFCAPASTCVTCENKTA